MPASVPAHANDPELATLVTLDGSVAACVLGFRIDAETGYLMLLFVHPERRRRGVGAFATRAFLLRLREHGMKYIRCEVRLDNAACLPFADGKLAPVVATRSILRGAFKSLAPSP